MTLLKDSWELGGGGFFGFVSNFHSLLEDSTSVVAIFSKKCTAFFFDLLKLFKLLPHKILLWDSRQDSRQDSFLFQVRFSVK